MEISLRLDVEVFDAKNIIRWLENKEVTKYLNEDVNSSSSLEYIVESNRSDLLTCYLNKDGRFFLIDSDTQRCLGFITLFTVRKMKEYEIVVAIGEPENWGKEYAYHALKEICREVFFNWRIEKLVANIHYENIRSIKLFEKLKFNNEGLKGQHIHFTMSFGDYLKSLN